MKVETKVRSAFKSLIWRIVGVIVLAAVTFAYTRSWITTGLVTVIHHGVFLFVFYYNERMWLWLEKKKLTPKTMLGKSLAKMFTYETLCGNIVLGTITYLITGSWKAMTAITLTYIGIKHLIYVFNEFIWVKIKWGKK